MYTRQIILLLLLTFNIFDFAKVEGQIIDTELSDDDVYEMKLSAERTLQDYASAMRELINPRISKAFRERMINEFVTPGNLQIFVDSSYIVYDYEPEHQPHLIVKERPVRTYLNDFNALYQGTDSQARLNIYYSLHRIHNIETDGHRYYVILDFYSQYGDQLPQPRRATMQLVQRDGDWRALISYVQFNVQEKADLDQLSEDDIYEMKSNAERTLQDYASAMRELTNPRVSKAYRDHMINEFITSGNRQIFVDSAYIENDYELEYQTSFTIKEQSVSTYLNNFNVFYQGNSSQERLSIYYSLRRIHDIQTDGNSYYIALDFESQYGDQKPQPRRATMFLVRQNDSWQAFISYVKFLNKKYNSISNVVTTREDLTPRWQILAERADTLLQAGKLSEAKILLDSSVALNKEPYNAQLLGQYYQKRDDLDAALLSYEQSMSLGLQLDPNYQNEELQKRIEALRIQRREIIDVDELSDDELYEMKLSAERAFRDYASTMRELINNRMSRAKRDRFITKYTAFGSHQIFVDSAYIVYDYEPEYQPPLIPKERPIRTYLNDFYIFYHKRANDQNSLDIDFSLHRIHDIETDGRNYYIMLDFYSQYGDQLPQPRRATMSLVRRNNEWKSLISYVKFNEELEKLYSESETTLNVTTQKRTNERTVLTIENPQSLFSWESNSVVINDRKFSIDPEFSEPGKISLLGGDTTNLLSKGLNYLKSGTNSFLVWLEEQKLRYFSNPYENSYAILVAIDDYDRTKDRKRRGKTSYERLEAMVRDAGKLKNALVKQGFPVANIIEFYDEDAELEAIDKVLKSFWLGGSRQNADRVFFYFGGHGGAYKDIGYLVTYNHSSEQPTITSLLMRDLTGRHSENIIAKHFMIAIDACHSGLAVYPKLLGDGPEKQIERELLRFRALSMIEEYTKDKARNVLVAGTGDQRAVYAEGGIFTKALTQGLEGDADYNRDNIIQFDELSLYVKNRVMFEAKRLNVDQRPQDYELGLNTKGQLVFFPDDFFN
ncbi:MAG: caspase family protein [Bacteroidota bacterium]